MTETGAASPLNMLIFLKFVPDPQQLQADAQGRPDLARAPFRISTFDENAIEAALQLRAQHGGRVLGVSAVGRPPPRDVLLRPLAMGLDLLYLVKDDAAALSEPLRLATALAVAARQIGRAEGIERWDLLLCGEASADEYNAQIGPRIAVALDVPAVTYATSLEIEGGRLIAVRGVEQHSETVEADLPALATVGPEINQARVPTVLQVMGAGRKPVKEITVDALAGFDAKALAKRPSIRTLDVSAPPSARKRVVITGDSVAETVQQLLARLGTDGEIKFS